MLIRILFFAALILLIDYYSWQGVKFVMRNSGEQSIKWATLLFWSFTVFCISIILATLIWDWKEWPKAFRAYAFALIMIVSFAKILWIVFLLSDDLLRGFRWVFQRFFAQKEVQSTEGIKISRSDFLVKTGLVVASVPALAMIWGMMRTAYNVKVRKVAFAVPDLPKAFEGFRIVQLSDIHLGSFMSTSPVEHAVKMVMEQKPDLILFSGDMVNNTSDELIPHIEALSKLKAKHGMFSILGNHDYGDYVQWPDPAAKKDNLKNLIRYQEQAGFKVLLDEHHEIIKDGSSINVIGVQNWSMHMRFPKYGDLAKATENVKPAAFNVLLSHDPSHWKGQVLEDYKYINLTLSGHTHGMQFGVELPFFKWSPVQYVYKEWAGIYKEADQHLYVNRGLGFLGYPGRVGILPEITLFELKRA